MEDTFGKIIAIFICVSQMFFIPLYIYKENIMRMEQTYIISEITYHVDGFRNTGMIDEQQYNNMRNRIFALSGGYDISITHCTHLDTKEESSGEYYNEIYYENNIEAELEIEGIYYMNKNDYINIYVYDKNNNVIGCYGGSVKNEAY